MIATLGEQPGDNQPKITELFGRVCDGVATSDELEALDALLQRDGRARQLWWEFIGVEAGIAQNLAPGTLLVDMQAVMGASSKINSAQQESESKVELAARPLAHVARLAGIAHSVSRFVRQYPVISCGVATVVVVLVVASLALFPQPGLPEANNDDRSGAGAIVFAAQLIRAHEAQWPEHQNGARNGAFLQAGITLPWKEVLRRFNFVKARR